MTELEAWATPVLALIPVDPDAGSLVFSCANLPALPKPLCCGKLVVEGGYHDYDTWRVDYPQWSGQKETYACLGLAILSCILHAASAAIELTSPASQIRRLVIEYPPAVDYQTGLEFKATSIRYTVMSVSRHPWVEHNPSPHDLPWVKLTNLEDNVITEAQRADRNCIHGFGSFVGSVRFARLLLDLSRTSNQTAEVALECEAGFRGVAPASAEIRLWLPGGTYWTDPHARLAG